MLYYNKGDLIMKKVFLSVLISTIVSLLFMEPTSLNANTSIDSEEENHREELREIWDDYRVDDTNSLMNFTTMGCTGPDLCLEPIDGGGEPDPSINDTGNILIALDSITDHVGLVADRYNVIEAHPNNPNGGVDYRENSWTDRYDYVKGLEVIGASDSSKQNAVNYAASQYGDPYSLATTRESESEWYCSKLVWRAWYEQGYDGMATFF